MSPGVHIDGFKNFFGHLGVLWCSHHFFSLKINFTFIFSQHFFFFCGLWRFFSSREVFSVWAESHDVFLYDVTSAAGDLWHFSLLPIVWIFFGEVTCHFVLRHSAVFKLFVSCFWFSRGRRSVFIFRFPFYFSPSEMPMKLFAGLFYLFFVFLRKIFRYNI